MDKDTQTESVRAEDFVDRARAVLHCGSSRLFGTGDIQRIQSIRRSHGILAGFRGPD